MGFGKKNTSHTFKHGVHSLLNNAKRQRTSAWNGKPYAPRNERKQTVESLQVAFLYKKVGKSSVLLARVLRPLQRLHKLWKMFACFDFLPKNQLSDPIYLSSLPEQNLQLKKGRLMIYTNGKTFPPSILLSHPSCQIPLSHPPNHQHKNPPFQLHYLFLILPCLHVHEYWCLHPLWPLISSFLLLTASCWGLAKFLRDGLLQSGLAGKFLPLMLDLGKVLWDDSLSFHDDIYLLAYLWKDLFVNLRQERTDFNQSSRLCFLRLWPVTINWDTISAMHWQK